MIRRAISNDLFIVKGIVHQTIGEVYPKYYPDSVVDFFLNHHSDEKIKADIDKGNVYLLVEGDVCVATGTQDENYMNRVFVLPRCQGRGYGSCMMDFLEKLIGESYPKIRIDSSLPAYGLYLKRGYRNIDFKMELVDSVGSTLCYHIMEKEIRQVYDGVVNLDGRRFVSVENTSNGEVSAATYFHYFQDGLTIWAEYSGGKIVKGFLVGKMLNSYNLQFTYQHINNEGDIHVGQADSSVETLPDGRLRMLESWQWLNKDRSKGESIVEEVKFDISL